LTVKRGRPKKKAEACWQGENPIERTNHVETGFGIKSGEHEGGEGGVDSRLVNVNTRKKRRRKDGVVGDWSGRSEEQEVGEEIKTSENTGTSKEGRSACQGSSANWCSSLKEIVAKKQKKPCHLAQINGMRRSGSTKPGTLE